MQLFRNSSPSDASKRSISREGSSRYGDGSFADKRESIKAVLLRNLSQVISLDTIGLIELGYDYIYIY